MRKINRAQYWHLTEQLMARLWQIYLDLLRADGKCPSNPRVVIWAGDVEAQRSQSVTWQGSRCGGGKACNNPTIRSGI